MAESSDRLDRIEKILEEFSRDINRSEQERLKSEQERLKNKQEEQERQKRIDKQFERTSQEVGKISNAQGYLVEGLISPAIPAVFSKMGISRIYRRAKSKLNGHSMEVDVVGPGEKEVIVGEIKSRVQKSDVDELLDKLPRFTKFFPEYKGHKVIGLVGGVNIDDGIDRYAEDKGLYVLGSSGDAVALLNKKGFKPKYF